MPTASRSWRRVGGSRQRSAAGSRLRGFTEVDPGCLQVSPGNEAHLTAFKTELVNPDLSRETLYLHTSPEFAAKKLLAAGEEKIFTLAHAFRNRERGRPARARVHACSSGTARTRLTKR